MSEKKEYIEKERALQLIEDHAISDDDVFFAVRAIEVEPPADVAPVVRCKDCKFIVHFTDGHIECRLLADLRPVPCTYLTMKETDFCSYGERRVE